jgi:hypothetical protein
VAEVVRPASKTCSRGGVEGELAVQAFRSRLVHSLGFAAYEASRLRDPDRDERVARSVEFFSTSPNQNVRAVAANLARMPDRDEFLASLDWMLDGVLAQAK